MLYIAVAQVLCTVHVPLDHRQNPLPGRQPRELSKIEIAGEQESSDPVAFSTPPEGEPPLPLGVEYLRRISEAR